MTETLPDGWGATTPHGDTLTRDYVEAYADLNEALGRAAGATIVRNDELVLVDTHSPSPFLNPAVLLRPVVDPADRLLDEVAAFFGPDGAGTPFLVFSVTPMPSLAARGWTLMGHPPLMLRPPVPASPPGPAGLEIVPVEDPATLEVFDRTLVEAFPIDGIEDGRAFHDDVLDVAGWRMWLGLLDGEPVGTAAAHVTDTFVDVEWISAKPQARGKRIGEALTWQATVAAPDRPAMLIASDLGQPVYERMGYLRLSRCTLWTGQRGA